MTETPDDALDLGGPPLPDTDRPLTQDGPAMRLYLVDGSGFIFRAFHALPPLTRKSDGLPIGAVSGFCNMIWKLLVTVVAAAWAVHRTGLLHHPVVRLLRPTSAPPARVRPTPAAPGRMSTATVALIAAASAAVAAIVLTRFYVGQHSR